MRYLSQRFSMPYCEGIATLTDVGTEELAHLEMICAIVHQLTRNLSPEEIKKQGFADYYVDHTTGIWPQAAGGIPFSSTFFQSKGDPITDLHEDMAAEQKARTTYDNLIRLIDDPDVLDPLRFLREREIVHFQRFGEALRIVQDKLDSKNFYAFNPAFDRMGEKREVQNHEPSREEKCCAHDMDEPVEHSPFKPFDPSCSYTAAKVVYNGNTGRPIR